MGRQISGVVAAFHIQPNCERMKEIVESQQRFLTINRLALNEQCHSLTFVYPDDDELRRFLAPLQTETKTDTYRMKDFMECLSRIYQHYRDTRATDLDTDKQLQKHAWFLYKWLMNRTYNGKPNYTSTFEALWRLSFDFGLHTELLP